MAKTLRVRTKTGWVTKNPANIPENWVTPEEIDDNFLYLDDQIALRAGGVLYQSGQVINNNTSIVWKDGILYHPANVLAFPYTITGDWSTEESLFSKITTQVELDQLESELQTQIDAVDTDNAIIYAIALG